MANKRKIETAELFEFHIKKFCEHCTKTGANPSDWALCNFLMISAHTLDRYRLESDKYPGYGDAYKTLVRFREDRLLNLMERDSHNATSSIFQLKQAKNGGYSDAPQITDKGTTIRLIIDGVGGEDAFR